MSLLILETPRLILREMSFADLDFVALMLADPEVMRFYPRCYSRDESQAWIERQIRRYARHGHGLWLAVEKTTYQPVGQVGLLIQRVDNVEEKEVAYLVHRPYWRRGFATEAALACRDLAFSSFEREVVIALIRPENVPSQGVAMKLGMKPRPTTVEHSGFEHHVFAITRSEWQDTRAGMI
jgi:[ribosomal protein S5]-alanine N-acetyltransferase